MFFIFHVLVLNGIDHWKYFSRGLKQMGVWGRSKVLNLALGHESEWQTQRFILMYIALTQMKPLRCFGGECSGGCR